jgi:hypothetical protein
VEKDRRGGFKTVEERAADFVARREEFWSAVFDFAKLGGVDVPGVVRDDRRPQNKQFSFHMETDGVGSSFVCWKPRGPPPKRLTPMDVPTRRCFARWIPG